MSEQNLLTTYRALCLGIPVGSRKVVVVPLKVRVFAFATRKVELCVGSNLVRVFDLLSAIVFSNSNGLKNLGLVTGSFVIEDGVEVDLDTVLVAFVNGLLELVFGTVLGRDGAFLVKLAHVPEIVYAVADIIGGGTFGGWRHPDGRETEGTEETGLLLEADPMHVVGGRVPLEELKHCNVLVLLVVGHGCKN